MISPFPTSVLFLLSRDALSDVYSGPVMDRVQRRATVLGRLSPSERWRDYPDLLAKAEAIFCAGGAPVMDREFLAAAPRLRAVFYAGGTVRYCVTPEFWASGVRISTAQAANSIPVSEYTVAALLLGLKRFWHYARLVRDRRTFPTDRPVVGSYGSVVGLISFGQIGRLVRAALRAHDLRVLVYDPFLTPAEAEREDVELVSLETLFAQADAVSLHAPHLPETVGLIRRRHFQLMKPGSLFINTARGEIVNQAEMIEILQLRPDLQAVLDVSDPEPPEPSSPLYTLPNVVLTPHIAGSLGAECRRMGHAMADEFERFLEGRPLQGEIRFDGAAVTA